MDWTDELSEKMLTIIIEDVKTHQGLFPGPGMTRSDGTGSNKQPKLEFEWTVAYRLFMNHETYANVFVRSTTTPKEQQQCVMKVKNRLTQFVVFYSSDLLSRRQTTTLGCIGLLMSDLG